MEFAWLPARWTMVACGLAMTAVAALVYFSAPRRRVNRRLAALLALQGLGLAINWGLASVAIDYADAYAFVALGMVMYVALMPAYLLFLATLPTPLVAPLRNRLVDRTLLAASILLPLAAIAWTPRWLLGLAPGRAAVWTEDLALVMEIVPFVHATLSLFGLAAAISVYRRAAGGPTRRQAAAYVAAFGWRDVNWVVFLLLIFPTGIGLAAGDAALYYVGIADLVFALLVAYGALKFQLLDLDLRLKWTIRRGTLVGAFVAVFVVVAAIVEQWLAQYGVLVGGVAVGLMLLALRPLERAADRIANATMPGVQDTPEYRLVRKRDLYRAAVESARADGEVTSKEREILVTLAEELGLTVREVHEIESAARPSA